MNELISKFAQKLEKELKTGHALEHAYRPALKELIESIDDKIVAVNDPKRQKVGAPDFIFLKNKVPIGYAETKDVDVDLELFFKTGANNKQFERYMALDNIFITNNLDFIFYRKGKEYAKIKIGTLQNDKIVFDETQFLGLEHYLSNFLREQSQTIISAKELAKMMAEKAKLVKDVLEDILLNHNNEKSDIQELFQAFKETLMPDISPEVFADLYAQTLAYGLFVARYHDKTKGTFTRFEAESLIPGSNPFLRKLFQHISGPDLDTKISWVVDELATVFLYSDMDVILAKFGTSTKQEDPVVHFYETFLGAYDKKMKKSRGVYYTPLPVVQFIVRVVDDILKKEFNLSQGIADTTKIPHMVKNQGQKPVKTEIHKVQILDPAVGTGTFLNEIIKYIHNPFKDKGIWCSYVKHDLIPRLHGFELLMAPYTMCHLKLALTLKETGCEDEKDRFSVWLTNSLEEGVKEAPNLLMGSFLSSEAQNAGRIKNETPIMVVLGNPPYSVSSSNKGEWILKLIKDYKKDLNEKKINLDDDYIKFIRLSEFLIDKNGEGIVAMITNNSYIDGITHRQMRKHLLENFDSIYIYDLHGNSKKKEKAPDGGKDENVFDIQQGVAISIFIKKKNSKKILADVYHTESFGLREEKYKKLNRDEFEKIKWNKLNYSEPYYFLVPKDNEAEELYITGFKIDELMSNYNSGIQSKRDKVCFSFSESELQTIISNFQNLSIHEIRNKYSLPADGRDWKIEWAKKDLEHDYSIETVLYRPFDLRKTVYTGFSKGFVAYPREKTFKNFVSKSNLGLITVRQQSTFNFQHILVSKFMIESGAISLQTKEWGYIFPLYLYTDDGLKSPNLKIEIISEIEKITGKTEPEDILDYIYASLHSPDYREKYKELLKIDFPRIPYPKDKKVFWKLVEKGKELREIHLLESPILDNSITSYPNNDGRNIVEKVKFEEIGNDIGRVMINSSQYFESMPKIAWEFYIGGYQPAQKWLKDRKGRELSYDDITHYQKVIVALVETEKIMREIDKININYS
jgi:predicted helicase